MFYIKTQLTQGAELTTEIHEDNVYTRCPGCSDEVSVDLAEVFNDGECDLYGTGIFCKTCSQELRGCSHE